MEFVKEATNRRIYSTVWSMGCIKLFLLTWRDQCNFEILHLLLYFKNCVL